MIMIEKDTYVYIYIYIYIYKSKTHGLRVGVNVGSRVGEKLGLMVGVMDLQIYTEKEEDSVRRVGTSTSNTYIT